MTCTCAPAGTGVSSVASSPSTNTLRWRRIEGPASRTRLARPGTRVSRSRTTSSTVPPLASMRRCASGNRPARLRGRWTTAGPPGSVKCERLDAPDRREVVRDPAPRPALVGRPVDLARARPEVDADRVAVVVCHRLAQHADERVLLWQPVARPDPRVAAVVRAPDGRRGAGHQASLLGIRERDVPDGQRVARMGRHHEPEVAGQVSGDLLPLGSAVGGAVDAAVVLLVQPLVAVRRDDELVDA